MFQDPFENQFLIYIGLPNEVLVNIRDQSVVITWGGPEEFRGDSLEIGLPKGGFTHLKILFRGVSKNTY